MPVGFQKAATTRRKMAGLERRTLFIVLALAIFLVTALMCRVQSAKAGAASTLKEFQQCLQRGDREGAYKLMSGQYRGNFDSFKGNVTDYSAYLAHLTGKEHITVTIRRAQVYVPTHPSA